MQSCLTKEARASIGSPLGLALLDSSLVNGTIRDNMYNVKLIDCNNYVQVYIFDKKNKKNINDNKLEYDIDDISFNSEENISKINNSNKLKKINIKNINRAKISCQRLAKCNSNIWQTFITLTYKENIKDFNFANNEYKKFIRKVQRVFKNFMCLCVPEFQKRGSIHYHLITNIKYDDLKLINENILLNKLYQKIFKCQKTKLYNGIPMTLNLKKSINDFQVCLRYQNGKLENTKKTYNWKTKKTKVFKTIKYWSQGFSNIVSIDNDIKKVVGYISKYMTKDIDNRLFGHHRYYYTRNLNIPKENLIDLDNPRHKVFYDKLIDNKELIFENSYINSYNGNLVTFFEFTKR